MPTPGTAIMRMIMPGSITQGKQMSMGQLIMLRKAQLVISLIMVPDTMPTMPRIPAHTTVKHTVKRLKATTPPR